MHGEGITPTALTLPSPASGRGEKQQLYQMMMRCSGATYILSPSFMSNAG